MSYRCIIWAAAIPLRFQWGSTERGGEREGESELEGCAVFGIHGTARDCCSQASNNLSPSSLLLSPTLLRYEMSPLSLSPSLSLLTSSSSSSTSSSLSPAPLPLLHLSWPHTPSPSPSPSLSLCALQSCGSHSEKSFAVVGFFIRPGVLRLVFLQGCFLQRLCKKNKNNFKKKVCSQQRREICTQRSLRKKKRKNTGRVGNFSCFILAGERLLLSPL